MNNKGRIWKSSPLLFAPSHLQAFTSLSQITLQGSLTYKNRKSKADFEVSTSDQTLVLNQLLENARKYKLPPRLLLVDTSNSTELNAVLQAFVKEGIDKRYVETVNEENTGCSLFTNLVYTSQEVMQGNLCHPSSSWPASTWCEVIELGKWIRRTAQPARCPPYKQSMDNAFHRMLPAGKKTNKQLTPRR